MATRVLIVDDSAYMRQHIRDILIQEEFDVVGEAQTGSEAIEKYMKLKPDVVTMDIIMCDESGIEALKSLIRLDSRAKVVMVSAIGQQALVVESIQCGARGFVIKPFKPEALVAEINRVV